MNYFPIEMLVESNKIKVDIPLKSRALLAVPIDQYDSEDFNRNDFGYIRNDISQLARAQSVQEYDLIMKRLSVLKSKGDIPADMKPTDAIARVRSRYLQSPNELLSYAESLANGDMQKLDDAYREALRKQEDSKPFAPSAPTVASASVPTVASAAAPAAASE